MGVILGLLAYLGIRKLSDDLMNSEWWNEPPKPAGYYDDSMSGDWRMPVNDEKS